MRKGFTMIELIIVVIVLLIIGSVFISHYGRLAKKREACAKLWTLTKTAQDSIQVIKACEIPEPEQTIYVQPYNRF